MFVSRYTVVHTIIQITIFHYVLSYRAKIVPNDDAMVVSLCVVSDHDCYCNATLSTAAKIRSCWAWKWQT